MIIKYTTYLHREPDEYQDFEIDKDGKELYSRKFHDSIHYVLYEIAVDIEADTETGSVDILRFRDGETTFSRDET